MYPAERNFAYYTKRHENLIVGTIEYQIKNVFNNPAQTEKRSL